MLPLSIKYCGNIKINLSLQPILTLQSLKGIPQNQKHSARQERGNIKKRYGNGCSFHDGDITTVFLQNSPFFRNVEQY